MVRVSSDLEHPDSLLGGAVQPVVSSPVHPVGSDPVQPVLSTLWVVTMSSLWAEVLSSLSSLSVCLLREVAMWCVDGATLAPAVQLLQLLSHSLHDVQHLSDIRGATTETAG